MAAKILPFILKARPPAERAPEEKPGEIVIFSGVRYERYEPEAAASPARKAAGERPA